MTTPPLTMTASQLLRGSLLVMLLGGLAAPTSALQSPYAVDVVQQVGVLDRQPSPMSAWNGSLPPTGNLIFNRESHIQGLTRHPDPEARVMYVSQSEGVGGTPAVAAILMDSADLLGSSRLRSNVLSATSALPFDGDRVVWHDVTGEYHPSGMQAAGDYLAVPTSSYNVRFYDIREPTAPKRVQSTSGGSDFVLLTGIMGSAGGLLQQDDGRYILCVYSEPSREIQWYQTTDSDIRTLAHKATHDVPFQWPRMAEDYCLQPLSGGNCPLGTDSLSPPVGLSPLLTADVPDSFSLPAWIATDAELFGTFNNMALLQDSGGLYLAAMWNRSNLTPFRRSDDVLALYDVELTMDSNGTITGDQGWTTLQLRTTRAFDTFLSEDLIAGELNYTGNFHAGATVWVSPEGELFVYAMDHYSDNYLGLLEDHLFFAEYHDPRSPLLGPADATTAHVAMYSDAGFNGYRVVCDYLDTQYQDYSAFSTLPGPCYIVDCDFSNALGSMSWHIPPGWQLKIYQDESFAGDAVVLTGTGSTSDMSGVFAPWFEDAASLEWLVTDAIQSGLHVIQPGDFVRQVTEYNAPLVGSAIQARVMKFQPGSYITDIFFTGPAVIDFPTRLQAVGNGPVTLTAN